MPKCNHPIGTACHCNSADPCVIAVSIKTPNQSEILEVDSYGHDIHEIAPLQNGEEQPVSAVINIMGSCNCGNSHCPSGVLVDENGALVKELSANQTVNLRYNRPAGVFHIPLLSSIQYLCLEHPLNYLPGSYYYVRVHQCGGSPPKKHTFIAMIDDIKDKVEHQVDVALHKVFLGEVPFNSEMIAIHPQYSWDGKIEFGWDEGDRKKELEAQKQQEGKPPQGKNIAHVARVIRAGFTVTGSISINEGGYVTEYKTDDYTKIVKEVKKQKKYIGDLGALLSNHGDDTTKSITRDDDKAAELNLLKSISDIVGVLKLACYQAPGSDKVKLLECDFHPPKITIKGHGESVYKDQICGFNANASIAFEPLVDLSITLDMLLAFATYFGMGNAAAILKDRLKKLEDAYNEGKGAAYAGADMTVTLETKISTQGSITKKIGESVEPNFSVVGQIIFSGLVNLRAEAKVWIFHGLFKFEAKAKAIGYCAVETVQKGMQKTLDYIFYHDGITADVEITISGDVKNKKQDDSINSLETIHSGNKKDNVEYNKTKHWVWVEAKTKENSEWRGSLLQFEEQ